MSTTSIQAGDRVTVGTSNKPAKVIHVGQCGWQPCRYGDECVTVWEDGGFTTTNYPIGKVTPVGS